MHYFCDGINLLCINVHVFLPCYLCHQGGQEDHQILCHPRRNHSFNKWWLHSVLLWINCAFPLKVNFYVCYMYTCVVKWNTWRGARRSNSQNLLLCIKAREDATTTFSLCCNYAVYKMKSTLLDSCCTLELQNWLYCYWYSVTRNWLRRIGNMPQESSYFKVRLLAITINYHILNGWFNLRSCIWPSYLKPQYFQLKEEFGVGLEETVVPT